MIIKIDVDGVIRNMNEAMCSLYNKKYNEHMTVDDIFDYDVEKVFTKIREVDGISACDFFFKEHAIELFLESKPYEDAKNAIQALKDDGHKVIIVTWQFTTDNKIFTLNFLKNNNIPYDDICFTRDKSIVYGDWLIDDNPEFILDENDLSDKIMVNMPYNKHIEYDGIRADSLQYAANYIIEYNKRLKKCKFDTSKIFKMA